MASAARYPLRTALSIVAGQPCASRILGAVPDLSASVLRAAVEGDAVWTEWEMGGTRVDGVPHLLRGVIIFGVRDGAITWARFYLEPVDEADADVNAAVGRTIGEPAT